MSLQTTNGMIRLPDPEPDMEPWWWVMMGTIRIDWCDELQEVIRKCNYYKQIAPQEPDFHPLMNPKFSGKEESTCRDHW